MLADGHARTRGVEQTDGLVGQLARRNVAMRQLDRCLDRLVEQLHAVVLLEHRRHAAQHQHGLLLVGLEHLHDLETTGQRRVLLDVLLVFGPGGGTHRAQVAAGQCRLEQVGRVARARGAAGADQGVYFVDEQDDRLRTGLHLVDHLAQALFEFAFHRRTGLQQAEIEREQRHALQLRRHVATRQPLREAFHDRGLADAGLAGEDRVVLATAHQDVDHLADLLIAPGDRVDLALAGLLGQVDRVFFQRFLLAHRRRRHRTRISARLSGADDAAVLRAQTRLARLGTDRRQLLGQVVGLDALELTRDTDQRIAQRRRVQDADQQVAGADLRVAEHQRAVHPALLDGERDVLGKVGDRGRTARQAVERCGDVARQHGGIERVIAHDGVQVGLVVLEQLRHPVHQLHIRVAAQLAEHGGTFDGFVADRVQLAEQGDSTDLTHGFSFLQTESSDRVQQAAPWRAARVFSTLTT